MLRLDVGQLDTLWETLLPEGVGILPTDLAQIDQLFSDPTLLAPFKSHWEAQSRELDRNLVRFGRPTLAMTTYLRLMLIKQRTGCGYETLMREVSDSFHLRRFCQIGLLDQVPHESTVRKLTRRLGSEVVDELVRNLVKLAVKQGFRPRAMRSDSTVIEADIRYPTDAGLAADAAQVLARAGRKVRAAIPDLKAKVRDRGRKVGVAMRELGRSLSRRTGEAKTVVEEMTKQIAEQVQVSLGEAQRLLRQAHASKLVVPGVSQRSRQRAIAHLDELIVLSQRVVEQIRQRFAGEKISDRLVSLFDPDARPVRRGKRSQPTQFGSVVQLTEVTSHTRRGARGLILPPKLRPGSTHENTLLPDTVAELQDLGLHLKEAAFDGGFGHNATVEQMAKANPDTTVFVVGSGRNDGSRRTQRRLARYRVGCEGRISHLKRSYGVRRSRLKGTQGAQIWTGWAALAYNAETISRMPNGRGG